MRSKFNYYQLLVLIPVIFISWFIWARYQDKPTRTLPFFGPKQSHKTSDTLYHTVPAFEFTNQYNEKVNESTIEGKIYVTEFFFTTCQSICPIMNNYLQEIHERFKDDEEFLILSHTVDPEHDSVTVLRQYAQEKNATDRRWLFLTGSKKDLYSIARKGYILNAEEGDGGEEDFIHTQNFALIDKERHVRGYYDGTDSSDVARLAREIILLKKEYDYKKRN